MANPLDTDAGSELFSTYEAELKLVEADVNQKLDQIPELAGEQRKAAVRGAERALDEAKELVCYFPLYQCVYARAMVRNAMLTSTKSWTR